ncbi:MAG: GNAT family N-acetyltransferase [Candidatus Dormibacter sp.]|uniref:GNAT family N-acetyltransferase n=1 Tax=Candidatus Dormibacter sp. TaxID=2973982 RepID=UPI000DB46F6B|nr:MAG: GNAT family N-acetyltransferase [Candidatus Dormibacteraeota bacterium]
MRELRVLHEAELAAYVIQCGETFGGSTPKPEVVKERARRLERERCWGYFDAGELFATAGAYSLQLSLPGGVALPTAGVSAVTVLPTHRRQGALTDMMRQLLRQAAERGEPIAALYASEGAIYGRFGFGIASYRADLELARDRSAMTMQPQLGGIQYRQPAAALDVLMDIERRFVLSQPGAIARPSSFWEELLADDESDRGGYSNLYLVLQAPGSERAGFALFRKDMRWTVHSPDGRLRVVALQGLAAGTYAALWRHLLDIDLVSRLSAPSQPVDSPLRHLLRDPHGLIQQVSPQLWLSLLDVPRALAGRRYLGLGKLTLEVKAGYWQESEGVFALEGGPDGAECSRTSESADLVLPTQSLAAAYLAGTSFTSLQRAGLVEECRPGALAQADAMFGWPLQPWCNIGF